MKLPLFWLAHTFLSLSVVHPAKPLLTITKDENAQSIVAPGGAVLLTPFTVSDMHPESPYIASIDYAASNGEQIPNLPETQFPGIDELNRYLRNNVLVENTGKPRDIQVVLRVLKPSTNTLITVKHDVVGTDALPPVTVVPADLGQTFDTTPAPFIPSDAVGAPVPQFTLPEMMGAPKTEFVVQPALEAPGYELTNAGAIVTSEGAFPAIAVAPTSTVPPTHAFINTGAIMTAEGPVPAIAVAPIGSVQPALSHPVVAPLPSAVNPTPVASAHHQITATDAILVEVIATKPIAVADLPTAVAKLLPPYADKKLEFHHSLGAANPHGLELSQDGDKIILSAKNVTSDMPVTIHIRDKQSGVTSVPFVVELSTKKAKQGDSRRTRMIVFVLSVVAVLVFLAAIIFEMMLAKKKSAADNREQTLNNLMNPNFATTASRDPYQP